ncbi:MAG TPA: ABC transporter substrate-binding protein [Burkholderiaceae bacterium]|jgi:multiple sugar transport system substrate-binding protein|nr:ABC transporter substrate-binding protein [Burkholderiaceae bacterium]
MTSKRRDFLKTSAGVAGGAAIGGTGILGAPAVHAQATWNNEPEKGARLRVLRWSQFVQGDIDAYMANVKKFQDKYGIEVRVDREGWEDVRPKAAVAANIGSGPDIVLSTNDDANLYPEKLVDVTDLADYLGRKYGGWYPVCEQYLRPDGKNWIGIPLGAAGNALVYRISQVKAAGFDKFPEDTDGFLKLMQALKAKGTPGGFALGNATGDGNVWTHWLLWAFGGKLANEKNEVVLNSPETIKALEYARALYETFVPGTLSWLDPHNNKAFLDGQCSVTPNGISIYYAAKTNQDPKVKEMAADIGHANMPIGPAGTKAEANLFFNQMIFRHTKFPKAAKEFIRFMMEEEQFNPWMQASIGYVAHPLVAYEKHPIWTVDPKHTPYRDAVKNMRPYGYAGKLGYASAGALADFIVVNMVAEAASGQRSPKEAAERAQKRAERYYKV